MAYSSRIHDPSFDTYLKKAKDYRFWFSFVLTFMAITGFYIYGESSSDMDNPEALYIGLVIGTLFLLMGMYSAFSQKSGPTWDGEVVEKEILEQKGKTIFVVYIENQKSKRHQISVENDATLFEYYKIGEKVRYHGKLKTYEKYDKSGDDIIFCNACAFMNPITANRCENCDCLLLK